MTPRVQEKGRSSYSYDAAKKGHPTRKIYKEASLHICVRGKTKMRFTGFGGPSHCTDKERDARRPTVKQAGGRAQTRIRLLSSHPKVLAISKS